jgi:hypothetical protein
MSIRLLVEHVLGGRAVRKASGLRPLNVTCLVSHICRSGHSGSRAAVSDKEGALLAKIVFATFRHPRFYIRLCSRSIEFILF